MIQIKAKHIKGRERIAIRRGEEWIVEMEEYRRNEINDEDDLIGNRNRKGEEREKNSQNRWQKRQDKWKKGTDEGLQNEWIKEEWNE